MMTIFSPSFWQYCIWKSHISSGQLVKWMDGRHSWIVPQPVIGKWQQIVCNILHLIVFEVNKHESWYNGFRWNNEICLWISGWGGRLAGQVRTTVSLGLYNSLHSAEAHYDQKSELRCHFIIEQLSPQVSHICSINAKFMSIYFCLNNDNKSYNFILGLTSWIK